MDYKVQFLFYGIKKDGSHDEFVYDLGHPVLADHLKDFLLKETKESFGDDIVSITFDKPIENPSTNLQQD